MSNPIAVAVVEDDSRYRKHLEILIDGEPGFRCVAACANAETAGIEIPRLKPNLILVDLVLPRGSGFELIARFRKELPEADIVVLTAYGDDLHLFRAMQAGAVSYLIKDRTTAPLLLESLRETVAGGSPMSSSIARRIVRFLHDLPPELSRLTRLTAQQRDLLDRIDRGSLHKAIAIEDQVSPRTISNRLRAIYDVLHVASESEALEVFQLGKRCGF